MCIKSSGSIGKLERKHIIVSGIDYIGKESNNLEITEVTGLTGNEYTKYERNINDPKFREWVLSLKPKDVKNLGISERGLRNFKLKIKQSKGLRNKSKIAKILFELYKSENKE